MLAPMQFKNYIWPHNPETYSVTWRRRVAVQEAPFGGACAQELGQAYRVMRGEGTFAGADAYLEFEKLAAVFEEEGPGLLTHPVWRTARAYFVSLRLTEEPTPDYVRYAFEFWEDSGHGGGLTAVAGTAQTAQAETASGESTVYHTVRRGDTLWGIAKRYGVTLRSLIAANPQIKNPNLISPGEQVRVK